MLTVCVGPTTALAQQGSMGSTTTTTTTTSANMWGTDWSRGYTLTPVEHKRLRALGLTDKEVFAAANAARLSRRSLDAPAFDDPVQMLQRGSTSGEIAKALNVATTDLDDRMPLWETAEWKTAVDEGWYTYPQAVTTTTTTTTTTTQPR
jgi:hypothetical protein